MPHVSWHIEEVQAKKVISHCDLFNTSFSLCLKICYLNVFLHVFACEFVQLTQKFLLLMLIALRERRNKKHVQSVNCFYRQLTHQSKLILTDNAIPLRAKSISSNPFNARA